MKMSPELAHDALRIVHVHGHERLDGLLICVGHIASAPAPRLRLRCRVQTRTLTQVISQRFQRMLPRLFLLTGGGQQREERGLHLVLRDGHMRNAG